MLLLIMVVQTVRSESTGMAGSVFLLFTEDIWGFRSKGETVEYIKYLHCYCTSIRNKKGKFKSCTVCPLCGTVAIK